MEKTLLLTKKKYFVAPIKIIAISCSWQKFIYYTHRIYNINLNSISAHKQKDLQGKVYNCPEPIWFFIKYVVKHKNLRDTYFFYTYTHV